MMAVVRRPVVFLLKLRRKIPLLDPGHPVFSLCLFLVSPNPPLAHLLLLIAEILADMSDDAIARFVLLV